MRKYYLFKDTVHGMHAAASSRTTAWSLIRNSCKQAGLDVPTMDKVVEVREMPEEEFRKLLKNNQ